MKNDKTDFIIITSDEPWCDIWHTQLHYAFQMSKRLPVFFLDPPTPWKISNLWKWRQDAKTVFERLNVVRYHNWVPAGFGKFSLWINDKVNQYLLRKHHLRGANLKRGIIWHFDPHRSYFLFKNHKNFQHIFHVIDPIANCNLDVPLARMAELVVVTSPRFLDHYHALNKNVLHIVQGVDLEFFREGDPTTAGSTLPSTDSILLLATLTDQIHFELLIRIAEKFPDKLVLIGPDKTRDERGQRLFRQLKEMDGVQWLGPMDPSGFRKHLKACRVGIIAYDNSVNYKNDFRSPLKVISYLACGKCIVSNIDCEIPVLSDKAIYIVQDQDAFLKLIERSYSGGLPFDQQAVNAYLNKIDYNHLIEKIFNRLQLHPPDVLK